MCIEGYFDGINNNVGNFVSLSKNSAKEKQLQPIDICTKYGFCEEVDEK